MSIPVIQDPFSFGLAEGIGGGLSSLAQALGKRFERQGQKQTGSILQNVFSKLPENASPLQVTQALSQAISQGASPEEAQKYGTLYATLQKSRPGIPQTPEQIDKMATLFEKFGMPKDIAQRNAELWGELTTGGQTEMARYLVDQIARKQYTTNAEEPNLGFTSLPEEAVVSEEEIEEFKFPDVSKEIFGDRTPKERTSLKTDLLKQNNEKYDDLETKLKSTDGELIRIDQLERLNNSRKLPQGGLQRLNINWTTGDIRFPAFANEETQLFVKTINDFTLAAKDTYGARVTNFELGAFMKRLPTLANTEEGRRLILAQMKGMKEIDRLEQEAIRRVYDHYGLQNIDSQKAQQIAREMIKDDREKLKQKVADAVNAQKSFYYRENAPQGHLPVEKPDGSIGYLPNEKIDAAKKKGWKIL